MPLLELPRTARFGNRLLERLPEEEFRRLTQRAERVTLPIHEQVSEPGEPARHVVFPLGCVLSAIVPLRDGSAVEAATTGREGVSGLEFLSDAPMSVYRIVVQVEGEALRLPAADFRAMLVENGSLRRIMERYVPTVLLQSGQTAACNLRHNVEERMARWLLMTHDRAGRDRFYLTQEYLGIMLGVRRQSVSLTASTLQAAGLIEYTRGNLTIIDRPGLEQTVCECYETIRMNYDRVLGDVT